MAITLTGVMIIMLALLLFLTAPRRLIYALIFFSSFSATAVVNFSNYGMAPALVFLAALIGWKLVSGEVLNQTRISSDLAITLWVMAGFGAASIASLVANQFVRDVPFVQVTQTVYVVFGLTLTFTIALSLLSEDRLESAIRAMRAGAVFISAWGLLQAACHYAGVSYPAFLFNNSTSHFADMFDQKAEGGLIRIASVAVEPSFMATSLMIFGAFGGTLLALEPRFRTGPWLRAVGITLFVVAASTSTTGYVGLAVLAMLIGRKRPGLMIALGACSLVAGLILISPFPAFRAALYEFTFNKAASGSYLDRTTAVWNAIELFLQHPILGVGWGGITSFSIVSSLLANVGLIGTFLFTAAISATLLASHAARQASQAPDCWRLRAYAQGAENALLVFMAISVVSGFHFVVADFWCLWALALAIPSVLVRALRSSHLNAEPSRDPVRMNLNHASELVR